MADGRKVTDFSYLPGSSGIEIPQRLSLEEMSYLTREYGVEFAQVYQRGFGKNGGGGKYFVYSGDVNSVKVPVNIDYSDFPAKGFVRKFPDGKYMLRE